MSNWLDAVKEKFSSLGITVGGTIPAEPEIRIAPEHAKELLAALQTLEGGAFDHLADLTAYDEQPKSPRYFMVYELISMVRKERCSVVVPLLSDTNPEIASVVSLWAGANWLEREVFDMYGIRFVDHPDLRRILLPPSFVGHPLQRDFVVDYRQQFPVDPRAPAEGFDPFGTTVVSAPKETKL